jgi:hypothetical protein
MSIKPIRPSNNKLEYLQEGMISLLNDLIAEYWDGNEARFRQDDIFSRRSGDRFQKAWNQVEEKLLQEFKKVGWDIQITGGNTANQSITRWFYFRPAKT